MFGSPSMDPHSVSSAMPLKAHSTPNVRLGSKESEVGALPVSTGQKTNDKSRQFLFFGMPVKPQSTPDTRVNSKEYSGSDLPGSTAEKTPRKTIVPRRPRSADRRLGPSMSSLNISRSSENLKTDRTTEIGTDMKTKSNQDTKGVENSATEIESRIAADSAPKPGDDIYEAARSSDFDYRVFTPSGGAPSSLEQPAANLDARPPSDKTKPSPYVFGSDVNQPAGNESRLPFKFEGVENTASLPHATESDLKPPAPNQDVRLTGQYGRPVSWPPNPRTSGLPSVDRSISKSLSDGRESPDLSDRNLYSDLAPLHGEAAAPHGRDCANEAIRKQSSSSNSARSDAVLSSPRMVGNIAKKSLHSETPVHPVESDRTQSMGAVRTQKKDFQLSNIPWAVTLPSITLDRASSAPPTAARMSIQENSAWSRVREGSDDSNGEFLSINEESDKEDESFASSPSPSHERRSISTTMICRTSPGGLDVIWKWNFAEPRTLMYQALSSILLDVCINLTPRETLRGSIYAFKAKDPQARGYVKIGVSKSLKSRLKTHEKCYGECELIYPSAGENPLCVEHAHRVESLIHAELVEYAMVLELCPKQRQQRHKTHGEWFDIQEQHAIAVIRKWCQWIRSSPYEEVPVDVKYQTNTNPRKRKGSRKPSTPSKAPIPPPTSQWRLKPVQQSFLAGIRPLNPLTLAQDIDCIVDETRLLKFSDEA
jgi:hypothetical protein